MVVKSLIKLIDEAIIPATLLILGKMVGLLGAIYLLNLPFEIKLQNFLKVLPSIHFPDRQAYLMAENFSNIAMFLTAALGAVFVIVRAHYFHASHISPKLHARLAALNLESIIAPSYHLYHQAVIWLTFLWLAVGFLTISTLFKITQPQITFVAFVIASNFTWVFAVDIEKEVQIQTKSNES